MPWRGPEFPGDFPSLGWEVAQWVQDRCVVPDREEAGSPFLLTDEQLQFLVKHYALDPETGRWRYERGSQLIRPRKWGKAPLSAVMVCAEAAGPVRFDGWDASGEPVGKPVPTPWIQCVACSQDQVANVWRVLLPIIQLGSLDADIPDSGETRINLPNGRIEPVTASARSRFGQRTTFAVMDETHLWHQSNGGHELASTIAQNLAGTGGRFLETTNAFDPVEASVAQRTFESKDPHVLKDDAPAPHGSVRNVRERDKVLDAVYGDSIRSERNPRGWIDKRRIHVEIEALLELNEGATAERMFMNRKLASEGAAFDPRQVQKLVKADWRPPAGSYIVLGVDGARHHDSLAVVATDVKTGHQWLVVIVERPDHAPEDYEHDLSIVDGAVSDLIEEDRYQVWRAYCDDQHIRHLLESWQNRFGEKRFVTWHTNRFKPIAWAVRRFEEAIAAGDVSFDANRTFLTHLWNARKRALTVLDDRQAPMHTLTKDHIRSPRKIDAAMAAVLSWEARGDLIASGVNLEDIAPAKPERPPDMYRADHAPAVGSFAAGVSSGGMSDME